MKKHFFSVLFLLTVLFGLVSCTHQFKAKPNVSLKIPAKQLYRSITDDYEIDSADVEIKLFTDGKEFDSKSLKITKDTPEKPVSVSFEGVPLESTVYAQANVSITENERTIILLTGKSEEQVLTESGLSLQIELKWTDESKAYIPDVNSEYFILKYNVYTYDSKKDIENPENYELKNTYTFKIYYKDFTNFTDSRCDELSSKIAELNFDMAITGYEQNTGIEEEGEPDLINGIAVLNSYWYKANKEVRPYLLNQKADISNYTLKLYKTAGSSYYVIEDKDGKRLAVGVWMIGIANIEPIKYGIAFMQSLKYEDSVPKLSIEPNSQIPYTPEFHEISPDGLTIKNLIGDTETTITFETSGLDVQALMSGTSPGPQVDSIVISIDCEDEMYAAEDTIKISAKYSKQNINVPLDKIYTEIYMSLIPTQPGFMPIEYEIYPNKDPNMPPEWAKDSYFNVTTNENTLILTPDFPDGFIYENNSDVTQLFYITVEADDGTITETDNKPITFLSGTRPDAFISMSPDPSNNNIPEGSVVTITAVKKDGTNVSADYISVEKIEQRVTGKNGISSFNEIPATSYSVDNADTYTKAITLSGLSDGYSYRITIVVDDGNELDEEKQFNVSITTPITQININGRTPSEMTSAITEVLTNVYNSRSKLHLKFSGENDATGYNLYSEVMEIANSKGFSPYSEIIYNEENEDNIYNSGIFTLDYSECGGAVVDSIPDETYQKAVILYSLKISPDTTKIGSKAFAGENSNVLGVILQDLDLKNVTEVGVFAFMWARIIGTLNMPKVTKLGDYAFEYFIGGTVNLDNLVKIDKLEEERYGFLVFANAEITTFYAPKLEVLRGSVFSQGKIYQIPDSLVIVDNNSLHFRNIFNVAFESDAGKQGWYQITGTHPDYTSDELMTLLYEHPENWDAVLAKTGVLTPIDPSDVISSFQNQGREFIRRK